MGNTSSISKLCVEWSKDRFRDPRTGGTLNVDDLQYKKYEAACINILNDRIQATNGDKQEIIDQLNKMCRQPVDIMTLAPFSDVYDSGELKDIVFIGNDSSEGKKSCFILESILELINGDRAAGRVPINHFTRERISDADIERIKTVFKLKIIKLIEKCGQEEGNVQIKEELKGYLRRFPDLQRDGEVRELLVNTCLKDVTNTIVPAPVSVNIPPEVLYDRFSSALYIGDLQEIENVVHLGFDINPHKNNALTFACNHNYLGIAKYMIEKGADVNYLGRVPLVSACMYGYLDIVKLLVENGADIGSSLNPVSLGIASDYGHLEIVKYFVGIGLPAVDALRSACIKGHLEIVKFVFENDIVDNFNKNSSLQMASRYGHLDVVKYLVGKGADISAYKYAALLGAEEKGHLEVAEFLRGKIRDGTPINVPQPDLDTTLKNAILHGYLGIVKSLIEKYNVNVNGALAIAAPAGSVKIVKYLVEEKGADVHYLGDASLILASQNGHLDVVKFLVEKGANIHIENDVPLGIASENGHLEVVQFLVQHEANIHANNDSALKGAAKNGHINIVQFLIENGADIHTENDYLLRKASMYGHLEVVQFLVENEADVHAENDSALRIASKYGHLNVVEFLIENGADIHAKNDSALRIASKYGHLNIVQFLVQHEADVHANNDEALKIAFEYGHSNIVKYLIENGADINVNNNEILRNAIEYGNFEGVKFLVDNGAEVYPIYIRKARDAEYDAIADYMERYAYLAVD